MVLLSNERLKVLADHFVQSSDLVPGYQSIQTVIGHSHCLPRMTMGFESMNIVAQSVHLVLVVSTLFAAAAAACAAAAAAAAAAACAAAAAAEEAAAAGLADHS